MIFTVQSTLGSPAKVNTLPNGGQVVNFYLVDSFWDSSKKESIAQLYKLVWWGQFAAGQAARLTKGALVSVTAEFRGNEEWQAKDGKIVKQMVGNVLHVNVLRRGEEAQDEPADEFDLIDPPKKSDSDEGDFDFDLGGDDVPF